MRTKDGWPVLQVPPPEGAASGPFEKSVYSSPPYLGATATPSFIMPFCGPLSSTKPQNFIQISLRVFEPWPYEILHRNRKGTNHGNFPVIVTCPIVNYLVNYLVWPHQQDAHQRGLGLSGLIHKEAHPTASNFS